jgi:hypothetical protein
MKARIGSNLSASVKEDIRKQFVRLLDTYNYEAAMQVLHILHFEFGFGEKRLQQFAESLNRMQKEQRERYELDDEDTPWLCEEQLQRSGIDIKKILRGGTNNESL